MASNEAREQDALRKPGRRHANTGTILPVEHERGETGG